MLVRPRFGVGLVPVQARIGTYGVISKCLSLKQQCANRNGVVVGIRRMRTRGRPIPAFGVPGDSGSDSKGNVTESQTLSALHKKSMLVASDSKTVETGGCEDKEAVRSVSPMGYGAQELHSVAVTTRAGGVVPTIASARSLCKSENLKFFILGGMAAVGTHYVVRFVGTLPVIRGLVKQFIWWAEPKAPSKSRDSQDIGASIKETSESETRALMALATQDSDQDQDRGEPVEWVNMCWRKAWRVYQRGLERWLAELLQPVLDNLVADKTVPAFVQKLRISEFTLDHEAPYFTNMRRRTSRKDSDLNGVVDVRYTGGARMVLAIDIGTGRYRLKVPVMVSDLDLECRLWLKLRLAPMCPYVGTLSLAFVGPPIIKVQLSPYDRVKLMRIPVIQPFLTKLFTVDLPRLMTLPQRLEIAIPPAVTAVAEAAIGRDAVMRAVASAVLQADALEHALLSALPLGPQGAAGGISLPDLFRGELQVTLKAAKDLPVWGFPWQSNPYCRLALGSQAVRSRKDNETSQQSRHRAPVWNQEFQFLVEDPSVQAIEVWIMDSPITGRTDVAYARVPLSELPRNGSMDKWFALESSMPGESNAGSLRLSLTYKPFQDDDGDSGYREAAAQAFLLDEDLKESESIIDVKTAADASSRAAVAASAAAAAVAVTKAAAARAAARLSRMKKGLEEGNENVSVDREEEQVDAVASNGSSEATRAKDIVPEQSEKMSSNGSIDSEKLNPERERGNDEESRLDLVNVDSIHNNGRGNGEHVEEETVKEISALADTIHTLTDDIVHIEQSKRSEVVQQVAEAESAAISAVLRGDVHAANEALDDVAKALEGRTAPETIETEKIQSTNGAVVSDNEPLSGEEKAKIAISAAKAAAAAAAAAVRKPEGSTILQSGEDTENHVTDSEDTWGTEAIPSHASTERNAIDDKQQQQQDREVDQQLPQDDQTKTAPPWWSQAIGWALSPWKKPDDDLQSDAVADADGSAAYSPDAQRPSWLDEASVANRGDLPVGDIVFGEDIPLEEIAAEVQKSWKLRDYHVETLVQKVRFSPLFFMHLFHLFTVLPTKQQQDSMY